MQRFVWLKLILSGLLLIIALAGAILPVAALISGDDINLSAVGGAAPDIEVSSDGQFLAVAYFRKETENSVGKVYVKSSTSADGWLTSQLVGFGSNPQLAFKNSSNNVVYVIWASNDNKAIQSARCTLSSTTPPACVVSATNVQTSTTASLNFPDIAVDTSGRIHAVWVNNGTVQSRSTNDDTPALENWSSVASVAGGGSDTKPVLAWGSGDSGRLHLALLRGTAQIRYFRSDDSATHSWAAGPTFASPGALAPGHDRLDNPTIAASGSQVYLAFDAHRTSGDGDYSLFQATSSDSGANWPSAQTTFAPSGTLAATDDFPAELKVSLSSSETPGQEAALRPSLAISGSTSALVWQEIPGECANFIPATIHFASPGNGGAFDRLENNGDDDYMIDPDIAVFGATRHIVYMRDPDAGCPGNLIIDYLISYRGPFTKTINDRGEGGGTFLPIVKKNN